jgi:hypothetical protein
MLVSKPVRWVVAALPLLLSLLCVSGAFAAQVQLAWTAPTLNTDGTLATTLAGYHVSYWPGSASVPQRVDVGNQTGYTLTGLLNGQTYTLAITAYDTAGHDSAYANTLTVTIPAAPAPTTSPHPATDLDGDGKADLVWRHSTTGQVYAWFMQGTQMVSSSALGTIADLGWQIVAVGDVNGDGKADLVWRHSTTGEVYGWLMQGTQVQSQGTVATVADLGWQIIAVGDVNGDGKADLIWQHRTTGQLNVWLMQGTQLQAQGSPGTITDAHWQLQP